MKLDGFCVSYQNLVDNEAELSEPMVKSPSKVQVGDENLDLGDFQINRQDI